MRYQKGYSLIAGIFICILVLAVLVIGGVYYLGGQKNSNPMQNSSITSTVNVTPKTPQPTPISSDESITSKSFSSNSLGITFNYPSTWIISQDEFVSEKPFVPGEQDISKIYNIIEMHKYPTPIFQGFTNAQWFNKIDSLTAPMSDQREKRMKLTSRTVSSGEKYVIFTDEPSTTAQGEVFKQVKAYILKDQTIYELTLDLYDNNGLEVFKKIVSSITVR